MSAPTVSNELLPIEYSSSDGEPVAETFDHLYALLTILETLLEYLRGQQATVLANQFLYYAQGQPNLRVAPDVMVIFNVEPGGRDNYKIWEEGQVPSVIFELTSASTRTKDDIDKKVLYQQLGVKEYWQFDPRGEWISEQLRGYRLQGSHYEIITDNCSQVLSLRLVPEKTLLNFYRQDTGEKLLIPAELSKALRRETLARQKAEQRAERLAQLLREQGIEPDEIL
ncbi:MAG: Uma2 family endonuclease [Cyanobacteria bacterium P01_H01_bin.15]